MLIILFLLFTVLPALELLVLIKVGTTIGALNTLILVLLIGAIGAQLARLQGFLVIQKVQDNLSRGVMPSSELLDGVLILVGGLLLLTPGFITDVLGIFLLIPPARYLIKIFLKKKLQSMMDKGEVISVTRFSNPSKDYDDIDVN